MFFVVTTGRSGSSTIARVLSQSPDCICLHEPAPMLVKEATLYQYGVMSEDMLRVILQSTRSPIIDNKVYGESNQKLSTLIPVLDRVFPDAKFLWLVRDGRDVVASTYYGREWYKPVDEVINHPVPFHEGAKEWTWYRLRADLMGEMSRQEWESLSRFEKNCWLWTRTNQIIQDALNKFAQDRWRLVRLEELFSQLVDISHFIGITPPTIEQSVRANATASGVLYWDQWDAEQKAHFETYCGDMMDTLYPGWRTQPYHTKVPESDRESTSAPWCKWFDKR